MKGAVIVNTSPGNLRQQRVLAGLFILLGLLGLVQALRLGLALFTPLSLDYTEQMLIGGAWQLQHNGLSGMYAPPSAPYGMPGIQYPPLFPALVAALSGLTGLGYIEATRFWSFGGYLGAALLLPYLLPLKEKTLWRFALAGLPFCFWPVVIYAHTARVDPLALFVTLLAVWLYRRSSHLPVLLSVSLLLVAAVCIKQTYLVAPAAIFLHLLISRRLVPAFGFAATFAGGVALGFAFFQHLSGGLFLNIFEPARAARFILDMAPAMAGFFLLDHAPLLLLALFELARQWREGQRFFPLYTLLSALSCVTIIKDGAVDYYFTELSYLLSLAAGAAVLRVGRAGTGRWAVSGLLAVQVLIAAGMLLFFSQLTAAENYREPYYEGARLVREAQQAGGETLVLADGALVENRDYGRIGDYLIYSILLTSGRESVQPLVNDLNSRRWSLVITVTPRLYRWPDPIASAFADNYDLRILKGSDGTGLYWVYIPTPTR